MSSSFTVSTRLASLFKRLNDLNERLDLSSAPTGKRTRSRGTRPIADLEWGNSMRREFEDFTKILKTRTKDLEGVLQTVDRKIDLELVDILETTCLKAFEVSGRLLKENPPVDVAALTPSSEDSAFEDRKTTSPILVAHTMVTQLMGAFDFMEKKDIPSQLQTVLSNPHFLESLMSIVFNERYPTLLRQRAGDFLTLGKTANTVESIIGDDTLLSSIVDLASRCTHVANYPILEQIVSFLHIVYKKCNAKKRKGEAEQIHKAIQRCSPPLHHAFPGLSNEHQFYDKIRNALFENQQMLSERFYDANTAPSNKKWFGEGEKLSFMFECSDVSFGEKEMPVGVAPWVDVNSTSLSFWCFDSSAVDAVHHDPTHKDAGDDVVPQRTSQHSAGDSSGPFSDPVLIQIPLPNVSNISYSKSSRNCVMTIDRRGFMESYLPKLVPFSKEDENFTLVVKVRADTYSDFRHALRQAHKSNGLSHSPVKPPSALRTSPSKKAVSPRARLNLGPEVAGQRREFSTRDLHTEADGDERQYQPLSYVTPSKKKKEDETTKATKATAAGGRKRKGGGAPLSAANLAAHSRPDVAVTDDRASMRTTLPPRNLPAFMHRAVNQSSVAPHHPPAQKKSKLNRNHNNNQQQGRQQEDGDRENGGDDSEILEEPSREEPSEALLEAPKTKETQIQADFYRPEGNAGNAGNANFDGTQNYTTTGYTNPTGTATSPQRSLPTLALSPTAKVAAELDVSSIMAFKQTYKDPALLKILLASGNLQGDANRLMSSMTDFEKALATAVSSVSALRDSAENYVSVAKEVGLDAVPGHPSRYMSDALLQTGGDLKECSVELERINEGWAESKKEVEKTAILGMIERPAD